MFLQNTRSQFWMDTHFLSVSADVLSQDRSAPLKLTASPVEQNGQVIAISNLENKMWYVLFQWFSTLFSLMLTEDVRNLRPTYLVLKNDNTCISKS